MTTAIANNCSSSAIQRRIRLDNARPTAIPAQKAEAVVERLLRIGTNAGELVLDCFAGSGTTGVVAERLGRRWLMIEREPAYAAIAERRLADERGRSAHPEGEGQPLSASA